MERSIEHFKNLLKQEGLYLTKQRLAVAHFFFAKEGHVCADEIFHYLRPKFPQIGRATVYRTIKLLKTIKMAAEVNFTGKRRRFEHAFEHPHHDHFICLSCKKTIEFTNSSLEKTQENIMRRMQFKPVRHRFEIWGYCRQCLKKRKMS